MVQLHLLHKMFHIKFMTSSFLKDGNQAEAYHLGKAIFLKVIEFSIAFKPTFKPMWY